MLEAVTVTVPLAPLEAGMTTVVLTPVVVVTKTLAGVDPTEVVIDDGFGVAVGAGVAVGTVLGDGATTEVPPPPPPPHAAKIASAAIALGGNQNDIGRIRTILPLKARLKIPCSAEVRLPSR